MVTLWWASCFGAIPRRIATVSLNQITDGTPAGSGAQARILFDVLAVLVERGGTHHAPLPRASMKPGAKRPRPSLPRSRRPHRQPVLQLVDKNLMICPSRRAISGEDGAQALFNSPRYFAPATIEETSARSGACRLGLQRRRNRALGEGLRRRPSCRTRAHSPEPG